MKRWFSGVMLFFIFLVTACSDVQTGFASAPTTNNVLPASQYIANDDAYPVKAASKYSNKVPLPKPPNTTQRGNPTDLSCTFLGCNDRTQVIGDRSSRLFYPCSCKDAFKVSFEDIICFRSFESAHEERFTRAPACD